MPTRGYRFVAPVTEAAPARTSLEVRVAEQSTSESPSAPPQDAPTTQQTQSAADTRIRAQPLPPSSWSAARSAIRW